MFSADVNGCRERSTDQISSGRRFISTSLSSSSEDEYLITLTASSLSLDSSDISSRDEDLDEIEAKLSPPVLMYHSDSSGLSSGNMTVSGYSSLSSSLSIENQYVELINSDHDSDKNSSFRYADISSSSHDTDEASSRDLQGKSTEQLLNVDLNSEESNDFIDQVSSLAKNAEIFTGAKRNVPFPNNLKSSSSDGGSSLECCINYEKYTYESNNSSHLKAQGHWLSPERNVKIKTEKSDITVENISKICKEKIKREDITYEWVFQDYYRFSEQFVSPCCESSESFMTADSDFEELGFRDTFAFVSTTKPHEFGKSSKQISCNVVAEKDDIVPRRQSKVTFAPPESLVTVRHFERSAEELEDDILFRAIVADAIRFQMRINSFKGMMDPFLTEEYRSIVMIRNAVLSMDE